MGAVRPVGVDVRYLITVEYDGTRYSGWQRQSNADSVQAELEKALAIATQERIVLIGSGRTDSGVHALGQAAHFDTTCATPPQKLAYSVNTMLPKDIQIQDIKEVPEDFHAQYGAKRKTYQYRIYLSNIHRPLKEGYAARVVPPLDYEKMVRATRDLVGKHDFEGFSSVHRTVKTTVRTVYRAEWFRNGDDLVFEIEGNGFLYNMVRIIVGTLIYVGIGKRDEDVIQKMLLIKDRTLGGKTFPPEGLYLKSVEYENLK